MTIRDLSEVDARLEEAVEHLATVRPEDDRKALFEEAAIAVLDGQHMNYPEGVLEAYLMKRLQELNA